MGETRPETHPGHPWSPLPGRPPFWNPPGGRLPAAFDFLPERLRAIHPPPPRLGTVTLPLGSPEAGGVCGPHMGLNGPGPGGEHRGPLGRPLALCTEPAAGLCGPGWDGRGTGGFSSLCSPWLPPAQPPRSPPQGRDLLYPPPRHSRDMGLSHVPCPLPASSPVPSGHRLPAHSSPRPLPGSPS